MKKIFQPTNALYPVPVVLVTAQNDQLRDIITVAWVGTCSSDPPTIGIGIRPARFSYSLIKDSGEFIVNIPSREMVRITDYCGMKSGRDVDKFTEMKLTPAPASKVRVPLIAEAPVNIECKVIESVFLGSHEFFIGKVLVVHAADSVLDEEGRINPQSFIAYGGKRYLAMGDVLGQFGISLQDSRGSED